MDYKINLAEAITMKEFTDYWAVQEVMKGYKITATKKKIVVWYDFKNKDKYAEFEVKTFEKDDLGVMVKCNDYEITPNMEIDSFDCTSLEIAKSCIYYFYSRF